MTNCVWWLSSWRTGRCCRNWTRAPWRTKTWGSTSVSWLWPWSTAMRTPRSSTETSSQRTFWWMKTTTWSFPTSEWASWWRTALTTYPHQRDRTITTVRRRVSGPITRAKSRIYGRAGSLSTTWYSRNTHSTRACSRNCSRRSRPRNQSYLAKSIVNCKTF